MSLGNLVSDPDCSAMRKCKRAANHAATCDAPPAAWIQAVSPGGLQKFAP